MSESEKLTLLDISVVLEALLFVSAEPVDLSQLATVLGLSVLEVEQGSQAPRRRIKDPWTASPTPRRAGPINHRAGDGQDG